MLGLSPDKLTCERPALYSPLKQRDNPVSAESEAEPDLPYTRDFKKPLGHLTVVLSDSHGNSAHVACDVQHPGGSSHMSWTVNPIFPGQLTINVSLATSLECEIDREMLQNLWQLVAYYYEYPAILERGQQRGNASGLTYQYGQAKNENSPYFTDLKGYLGGEPSWLLQPKVTLKLNRQQTTSKRLVMEFATVITQHVNGRSGQEDENDFTWALIRKGTTGRVQTALEGSKVTLECSVVTSDPALRIEWVLPDLSIVEDVNDKIGISETGQLVILNVTLSDSGLYHCMVRTKTGVDLVPIRLTIKERSLNPTAINGQKILVENGQSFSLPCEVKSVQPSLTVWYLPRNQVLLPTQQTRRAEVMENGTLIVRGSTKEDAGEYSCLASNLYGADMLAHMVEVTQVTDSYRSQVQAEREQHVLPSGAEEEGSGGDYQEIIRVFATQVPSKAGTQKRKPYELPKRIKVNDSKRKPNKSVKELDPNRWEEIMAKVKAKPSVLPINLATTEPDTVNAPRISSKPISTTATTVVTTDSSHLTTTPSDVRTEPTKSAVWAKVTTKVSTAEEKSANGQDYTTESLPQLSQPPPPRSTEQTKNSVARITETVAAVTKDAAGTPKPFNQSENKHYEDRRRNYNLVPGQANRRRLPYRRRRPPMRRLRPHVPPLYNKPNNTQSTIPTLTTTKTTTTATTTTTPALTTVENYETLSAKYQTVEKEVVENIYRVSDNLDVTENVNSERSYTTNELDKGLVTFHKASGRETDVGDLSDRHHFPSTKTVVAPTVHHMAHPTQSTVKDSDAVKLKISERPSIETGIQTAVKVTDSRVPEGERDQEAVTRVKSAHKHTIEIKSNEESEKNIKDDKILTTQNRSNLQPSEEQNKTTQASPFSKITTLNTTQEKTGGETRISNREVNKPKAVSETHIFPIMEPVHPWLHQSNQGGGQTTASVKPHSNRDKNTGNFNKSVNSGAPPISRWPSNHHHHHFHPLYPTWPGQRSAPHPRHGK